MTPGPRMDAEMRDHRGLPPWFLWTIPALLIPICGMAWLSTHWSKIPGSFPISHGPRGAAAFLSRTPLHVCAPLIFAAGMVVLLIGVSWFTWYASRSNPGRIVPPQLYLILMYLLSVVFTGIGLKPALHFPGYIIPAIAAPMAVALVIVIVRQNAAPDDSPATPAECWSPGGIYHNPSDPSLFVANRLSMGDTLNFAHPWAKPFLFFTIFFVLALTGFLLWALR